MVDPTAREAAKSHWRYEQERKAVADPGHHGEIAMLIASLSNCAAGLSAAGIAHTLGRIKHLKGLPP